MPQKDPRGLLRTFESHHVEAEAKCRPVMSLWGSYVVENGKATTDVHRLRLG